MSRYEGTESPVIARLRLIARELGHLRTRVVFIGGAIAPLLQTQPVVARVRPTEDVDALTLTTSYGEVERMHAQLRDLSFREAPDAIHVNRWASPSGALFDLVHVGTHFGASGSELEQQVIDKAVLLDLAEHDSDPLPIRHADAVTFLALKWVAFRERGANDLLGSHDIEDMFGVIASRPELLEECQQATDELLRRTLRDFANTALSPEVDVGDVIAAHLSLAGNPDASQVFRRARDTLRGLAAL